MPYLGLEKILADKKIPAIDNVSVLREIESRRPGRFQWSDLPQIKSNVLLHESAHGIAEDLLSRFKNLHAGNGVRPGVLRLIMAESLANTVEALANIAHATPEDRIFNEMNSYAQMGKKTQESFIRAIESFGADSVFRLLWLSYLFSNALHEGLSGGVFGQVLERAVPDETLRRRASGAGELRRVSEYAFELSMTFRIQTTGFYCAMQGLGNGDVRQLMNFDVLAPLPGEKVSPVRDFLSDAQARLSMALAKSL